MSAMTRDTMERFPPRVPETDVLGNPDGDVHRVWVSSLQQRRVSLPNAAMSGQRSRSAPVACSGVVGSQIAGPDAGMLRDPGKHPRSDLLRVMEGEHEVRPASPR